MAKKLSKKRQQRCLECKPPIRHVQCAECGENIPYAAVRPDGRFVCTACFDDAEADSGVAARRVRPGQQDREYHGGLFNRGEW